MLFTALVTALIVWCMATPARATTAARLVVVFGSLLQTMFALSRGATALELASIAMSGSFSLLILAISRSQLETALKVNADLEARLAAAGDRAGPSTPSRSPARARPASDPHKLSDAALRAKLRARLGDDAVLPKSKAELVKLFESAI